MKSPLQERRGGRVLKSALWVPRPPPFLPPPRLPWQLLLQALLGFCQTSVWMLEVLALIPLSALVPESPLRPLRFFCLEPSAGPIRSSVSGGALVFLEGWWGEPQREGPGVSSEARLRTLGRKALFSPTMAAVGDFSGSRPKFWPWGVGREEIWEAGQRPNWQGAFR